MTVHTILKFPDPVLEKPSVPVERFDDALAMLAQDLDETMRSQYGAGISAVQIGHLIRLFVLRVDDTQYMAVVNPEILEYSAKTLSGVEGCLSFPGVWDRIDRSEWVTAKWQNLEGAPIGPVKLEGFYARVFQHENDHLEGSTMLLRMTKAAQKKLRKRATKEVQK